ncbi:HD domain-containing protein [Candidatus Desantisbacteria bacterium]|nr:HD domain-containing protein [Candidatus Desantisbacteria bacterium]
MIREAILRTFYDAASMQRWNDHIRPVELTELDKQAHKMIIAFVVGRFEETVKNTPINWRLLIEGGIFEFLQRIIITDIKPTVFHKIIAEKGDEINRWVLNQLKDSTHEIKGDFVKRFEQYLFDTEYAAAEKKILKASHYLATSWEFGIIYNLSPRSLGIEETKRAIENEIAQHDDLIGVQKWYDNKIYGFLDICGTLRFQQRWAQAQRVPKTSVLGHMLIVAMFSYLCSIEVDACDRRLYNNYFTALFHDLPEALTRDIVSPVKRSVKGLEEILSKYEQEQLDEKIFPLLPIVWHDEIRYLIIEPFKSRVLNAEAQDKEGTKVCRGWFQTRPKGTEEEAQSEVISVSSEEINKHFNQDKYSPVDGEIIKACDCLAAYMEAALSIEHGIASHHLTEGKKSIYHAWKDKHIAGIHFGQIFDYFK